MSDSRLFVVEEEVDVLKRAGLELQENKNLKLISLGEMKASHDDDGFKTPTSLDHKIPVMKQCPPLPRKPKPPPSNKRKPSPSPSSSTCRNLQLDFSKEVDSLFPTDFLAHMHRKVKKARKQDHKQ
ncbi:hypothetical protein V6N13_024712 [Hibiscus sabdariffa]|uniref:Uncharacterized protein n=1 Tax=Hibiscus sabdariffa TaxID=183260 RepID=A0ABR2QG48_9ROSI